MERSVWHHPSARMDAVHWLLLLWHRVHGFSLLKLRRDLIGEGCYEIARRDAQIRSGLKARYLGRD
jgi:hypothetical protein